MHVIEGHVLVVVRQQGPAPIHSFMVHQALFGKIDLTLTGVGDLLSLAFLVGKNKLRPEGYFDPILPQLDELQGSVYRLFGILWIEGNDQVSEGKYCVVVWDPFGEPYRIFEIDETSGKAVVCVCGGGDVGG